MDMISVKSDNSSDIKETGSVEYKPYDKLFEYKSMEERIHYQSQLFQNVIENLPDTFLLFDEYGKIILMNSQFKNWVNVPKLPKNLNEIYDTFDYYDLEGNKFEDKDYPGNLALKGIYIKDKTMVLRIDDDEKIISVTTYPIYNKELDKTIFASQYRDITDQFMYKKLVEDQQTRLLKIEMEKNEQLSRSMEIKDEFFIMISHELKTPIAVINSAVQAIKLLCKDELSQASTDFLEMILQNSNRQLKLVNNLLDISHIESESCKLRNRNIDIVKLTNHIVETIRVYSDQKKINLVFTTTMKKRIIGIDEEKYEKILLNLLSNAVKFTSEGKMINVKLSLKRVDNKYMLCLQVKDEGIGIPEDKADIIFEKFGQVDSSLSRQAEGSGIGLSLVKKLVILMGGDISLESEAGKGSNFIVLLPITKVKDKQIDYSDKQGTSDRLNQSTIIEFSDIYF
jgi:signal transduction histidine kinase